MPEAVYQGSQRTEFRGERWAIQVKNKAPAERQITVEHILRESKEIQLESGNYKAPKQIITDPEELAEYRLRTRKHFEDTVRRIGRFQHAIWNKYAIWEEQQKDFRRARSVFERALDVTYTNPSLWTKYAEMEMRHRFINHARNVWDRAVTLLPRVDQLWYKYIHMEEMLGNVAGARQIFERWMRFEPDHMCWMAYIKSWIRYAKFEMQNGKVGLARQCYERAVEELGEDAQTEEFFIKFAEFEEMVKEYERCRAIYKYALDHIPKNQAASLYTRFVAFEKQHGDREGIEDVVVSKRRFQYEEEVRKNPLNYDNWFDYIKLEEDAGDVDRVREVYERAVANLPPANEKRYWQRYIYLWIKYAIFEELDAGDVGRAREVYRAALKLVPHHIFTFSKLWVLAANLEIRAKRVDAARRIMGMAVGMAPKDKTFKSYIEMELCRTLYEKYLEWQPANCHGWTKFADLEKSLGEVQRTRGIYELAISQPVLDMPEALWKAYIDFEISVRQRQRTRILYERLLDRTKHVKVWLSYASFEASPLPRPEGEEGDQQQEVAQAAEEEEEEACLGTRGGGSKIRGIWLEISHPACSPSV
ncbi:crooked neck-like protein 1-like protein [Dunaliella salina]|uniref:Crooked neck-like protein 1-like protein n=1 Tax=Dunaliella salina TaxID=3046 RepID=A0ABQ7GKR1_DUNSA|nr:crooked neck-like protein 1-like protein [Dunaliella salina]|eukprot:KAF5835195.1 crooked neck-like protein 1-like protein [Dunaliella salina]